MEPPPAEMLATVTFSSSSLLEIDESASTSWDIRVASASLAVVDDTAPVPEPGSLALAVLGIGGVVVGRARRRA